MAEATNTARRAATNGAGANGASAVATQLPAAQISYRDLYARWEKGNWSAMGLDFTVDREQWWGTFTDFERKAALWNYALFFWGEDAVADNLSPYIDAAPLEEQKYFLTTQQVDEARHAVFFRRFMQEVAEVAPDGDMHEALEAIRPQLTWGFRKVFDRLDLMADELRKDRSLPQLAKAITLYHFVIEASLAQPGQHFIESYLTERDVLPGFREGMANVALDEQRHIAFGVKMVADLCAETDECKHAVADILREVVPWTAAVLAPPGWDRNYVEVFGTTMEEVAIQGITSLEVKLRSAGIPLEELPGPPVLPRGISPAERAEKGLKLVEAGVMGEKTGVPRNDPELREIMFHFISRSVMPEAANGHPFTIQWDLRDAEPWFIRVDNGSTAAEQGRHPAPDVTLEMGWEDFVDTFAGRVDPRKLVLRRRVRPHGGLRNLRRMSKVMAARY